MRRVVIIQNIECIAAPCCLSRRTIKQKYSPDRNYNETIQDAQDTFEWSSKHIFRPHQHFTYDPTSWSRPLQEKEKKRESLSLIQRLKTLQEREEERARNVANIKQSSTTVTAGEEEEPLPDYFYEAEQGGAQENSISSSGDVWSSISLQEMLDEMQRLRNILNMPRFAHNASLSIRDRQRGQYETILVKIFRRLESCTLGETMSREALIYSWFLLVERIADLLEAVAKLPTADASLSPDSVIGEQEAIATVFKALEQKLLSDDTIATFLESEGSLEADIEALFVITHPFTLQCTEYFASKNATSTPANSQLDQGATQQLCYIMEKHFISRMTDATSSQDEERLLPMHLSALCSVLCRIPPGSVDSLLPLTTNALKSSLEYTLSILKGQTEATAAKHHRRIPSLTRPQDTKDAGASRPRAALLAKSSPPRGIKEPLTEADDVYYALRASSDLLSASAASAHVTKTHADALDALLGVLSHSPNYDINVALVVQWSQQLMDAGLIHTWSIEAAHDAKQHSLRWMLLLSRLDFASVSQRGTLSAFVLSLCNVEHPDFEDRKDLHEWRRLRGLVMKKLLETLRAEELLTASQSWEEELACRHFDGLVPMGLWRDACTARFGPAQRDTCAMKTADALMILRARLAVERRGSRQVPLDTLSVGYLADCIEVLSGGRISKDSLFQDCSQWDEAVTFASDDDGVLAMLADAKALCTVSKTVDSSQVVKF